MSRISIEAIREAATVVDPVFLSTPQFVSDSLGEALGAQIVVKVETVNPIRSFKGRGADYFLHGLEAGAPELVCASAGNFGQGMAWAARRRGRKLDVFASENANPLKVERMRALGASVHIAGSDFDAAKDAAREFARQRGAWFVEDGKEPAISEGAGTIALELLGSYPALDAVVVPLGNGALLGGIATWVRAHSPATRIVGVCAARAPSMELSWRARRPVSTKDANTIADGIAVRVPIPEAVADLQEIIDDILLVDDSAIRAAMSLLLQRVGIVVEPAGAAGVAAIAENRALFESGQVATVLCGGNVITAELGSITNPS